MVLILETFTYKESGSGIDVIAFYNSKLFVSHFLQFGDSQYDWIIIDTLGTVVKKKRKNNSKICK